MKLLKKYFYKTDLLCVASFGGHWVQLKLITSGLKGGKVYLTTENDSSIDEIYIVNNASANNKLALLLQFLRVFILFLVIRPKVVISTGASIGLVSIVVGRFFLCKTIWVDSIANYERLSRSGQLARKFASVTLSQWPHVAEKYENVYFEGAIL